ncbi:MAG: lipopolysaccharide biosynthesis protein, partial [Sphingobacteriia bacterium]|nr:lipopolysaccharide biosynthesis protein [Sphingobacteriia bacterium]
LLNAIYTEVLKNLEMTRFSLLNETPVINIIDEPRYPLPQEKAQLLIWILGGGIIGLLLSAFTLLGIALRQSVIAFLK